MKLNHKYFKIRTIILVYPILFLLMCLVATTISKDYNCQKNEALSDSSFIKQIAYYTGKDEKEKCLDIALYNRSFIIRLRHAATRNWANINDYSNVDKSIRYLYLPSQMQHDTILYDPRELEINQEMIVSFEESKPRKNLVLLPIFILLLFGPFFIFAINTYNSDLLQADIRLWKKRRFLRLIGLWLWSN